MVSRVLLPEGEGSEEEARMFRGLMMLMMMMVVVVVMGISGDIDVAKWGSCKFTNRSLLCSTFLHVLSLSFVRSSCLFWTTEAWISCN